MTCSIKTYFTVVLSVTSSVNKVIHSNHFLYTSQPTFSIPPFIPHFSCLLIFSYGFFTRLHCFTTQGFHTTSIHKLNDSTFHLVLLPYLSGPLATSAPGFRADGTFGVQAGDPMKVLKRTPVNVSHTNSKCWVTNFQLSDRTG